MKETTAQRLKKVTVMFRSRSNPEVTYKTERHRNGRVTCFCPGFVYHGNCWHADRLRTYKQLAFTS